MNKKTIFLLCALFAAVLCSCKKGSDGDSATRSEFIKVYETSADKTVDLIQVPFDGVEDGEIHVLSNVELEWKYLVNQSESDTDWFVIKEVKEIEPGHTLVTYDASSILVHNSLERRSGRLSFSCPEASLGKFLSVHQGYERRFLEQFKDEPDGNLMITGKQTYTTEEHPELNSDYFDYISFNAWAVSENEFMSKNITLDVTVSGGHFYDTGLTTYRVNVPLGTAADKSNLKYLLVLGDGVRMSPKTKFTFSCSNDDQVYVHIDNLAAYRVTEAEWGVLIEDDYFEDDGDDGGDWI